VAVRSAPVLSAGTHLVREWNGRTYQVEVTRSGYVMDGKSYRSLTAIARRITGANWSGPRFFGLVDRSDRQGMVTSPGLQRIGAMSKRAITLQSGAWLTLCLRNLG
jgi:hypothetical protein